MVDTRPPGTAEPSLGKTIGSGFAWGVLCAIGTAISAIGGHLAGMWVYPYQMYEQFPMILVFVPLGLIVGFSVGGWARITCPQWTGREMRSVAGLSAGGYAFAMFWYAQAQALPPGFGIGFEPYMARAQPCAPTTCPQENPPLDWTFEGHILITGMRLSGTVDAIEMEGMAETLGTPRPGDHVILKELKGPTVRLTGDELVGPHEIRSGQRVSYPIRYSYRARSGDSGRKIIVTLHYTDSKGQSRLTNSVWEVK